MESTEFAWVFPHLVQTEPHILRDFLLRIDYSKLRSIVEIIEIAVNSQTETRRSAILRLLDKRQINQPLRNEKRKRGHAFPAQISDPTELSSGVERIPRGCRNATR